MYILNDLCFFQGLVVLGFFGFFHSLHNKNFVMVF